ncbi:MAG: TetR/AcrR family transcriptional regulator [Chlorobiaceae bacterium]|nr:TetR/AcrR family transcriptional regulator [Chlorobiaceae bacterium]
MARTKKVTSAEILDATERVVVKLGSARLSIDAVAKEAGISKSRVVYDYKSKGALLEALIDRQFQRGSEQIDILVQECADTPHPELFARIKMSEQVPDDTEKAVAVAVSASVSSEATLKRKMQDWFDHDLKAIDNPIKREASYLAFFALVGFGCHEWLGLINWESKERLSFLDSIRTMYSSYPDKQS